VANEAARIATVNAPGIANFKTTVCNELETSELRNGTGSVDAAKVSLSYPDTSKESGDPVRVVVKTTYHWLPFWNAGSLSIAGSATMRLEHAADNGALAAFADQQCP
jgi:hypothetical protein